MNAKDYTNSLATFNVQSNGMMPYLRRLSIIEIMGELEQLVIDNHIAAARPYLKELEGSDERIAYLKATQQDEPIGIELTDKALDEMLSEPGIDRIVRYGLVECNKNMDINGFMSTASIEDIGFIYNVFCADIHEKYEVVDTGSGNGKKPKKTRKAANRQT